MIEKFKALNWVQKKGIVAAAAGLAVFFLGWKILVKNDIRTLKALRQAAAENAPKQAVVDETGVLEKKLKDHTAFLSTNRQADWLIDTVNTYASESGLSLLAVAPQTAREGNGDYGKIVLTLEADGTYHELGHFVEKIENQKPLIKINFLRILRVEERARSSLKFTMTLSAFYPIANAVSS